MKLIWQIIEEGTFFLSFLSLDQLFVLVEIVEEKNFVPLNGRKKEGRKLKSFIFYCPIEFSTEESNSRF